MEVCLYRCVIHVFCICCISIAVQVELEDRKGGEEEKGGERGGEEGGERGGEETDGEGEEEERGNDQREEAAPEKLPDDDVMKEPFYLRAFFTVFPMLKKGMVFGACTLVICLIL